MTRAPDQLAPSWLPLLDDEAVALFEVAVRHEVVPPGGRCASL
jgi:hypothetical protein